MSDVKNSYETVFILSTKLGEDAVTALVQKFKDLIEANGTIDSIDEWGKRRLAYPIKKQEDGYYTLVNFTSAPEFTAELDRIYKITDGVLRSLIIKKESKQESAKKEE
nr:30S ribosomal protein S6 [uncultured Caproiciproducens sp.]